MTWISYWRRVIGEAGPMQSGPTYPDYSAVAKTLTEVRGTPHNRNTVRNWAKGSEPRGGLETMLGIARDLGYSRDEALTEIAAEEAPASTPDVKTMLVTEKGWPEGIVVGFFATLDDVDQNTREAALAAALATAQQVAGLRR